LNVYSRITNVSVRIRENYQKAFAKFDAKKVAKFDATDVERLPMDYRM
jgi:3-methyladenine DNA glycosylase Tag